MRKTVICSHGFAVRADSMGMFTDIATAFPGYEFRMFDYYDIKPNGDQIVRPLDEQAEILQQQIDAAPEGEVVVLCHSQGSTVAGLADMKRASKVILLAPPVDFDVDRLLARLARREGSRIDRQGESVIPRSDGTAMYIPASYLDSIDRDDRMKLYQNIADTKPTVTVRALQDEMLGVTPVDKIRKTTLYSIEADHNFRGESRQRLIDILHQEL